MAETALSAVHNLTWSPDALTAVVDSWVFCEVRGATEEAVSSCDLAAARLDRASRKLWRANALLSILGGLEWTFDKKGLFLLLSFKVNIVRFSTNVRPLLLYKLKMLRVVSPKSKVQQRITTKKIANDGCGSLYISKNINRWQPLLTKRALVFAWKIPLLAI